MSTLPHGESYLIQSQETDLFPEPQMLALVWCLEHNTLDVVTSS